jgi:hypothetical protein
MLDVASLAEGKSVCSIGKAGVNILFIPAWRMEQNGRKADDLFC